MQLTLLLRRHVLIRSQIRVVFCSRRELLTHDQHVVLETAAVLLLLLLVIFDKEPRVKNYTRQ